MSTNNNAVNFKDQVFFVGIDVHKNQWTITIRNSELHLDTCSIDPYPEQLFVYLKDRYPGGTFSCVYEAGFCGFWIQKELKKLGVHCIVVNPADIPTTHKEKVNKTDPRDSKKLAKQLESGNLKAIHAASLEDLCFRSLCRLRFTLTKECTRSKNRISQLLYFYGCHECISKVDFRSRWSAKHIEALEKFAVKPKSPDCFNATLSHLLTCLKNSKTQLKKCDKDLRKAIKTAGKYDTAELLMTVPGVGFLTAATLLAEIIDINRFPTFNHLASFAGFIPAMKESGDSKQHSQQTPRGHKRLKALLIEAAWIAIRKDTVLLQKYNQLKTRMRSQKAIIRVAKKMLSRIRSIWRNRTEYITCKPV